MQKGCKIEEMKHSSKKTFCCGEGGAVGYISSDLSANWGLLRKGEAERRKVITYCAGCSDYLGRVVETCHLLDLVFEPEAALSGKSRVSRSPFTYFNRYFLKRWFRKLMKAAVWRERRSDK